MRLHCHQMITVKRRLSANTWHEMNISAHCCTKTTACVSCQQYLYSSNGISVKARWKIPQTSWWGCSTEAIFSMQFLPRHAAGYYIQNILYLIKRNWACNALYMEGPFLTLGKKQLLELVLIKWNFTRFHHDPNTENDQKKSKAEHENATDEHCGLVNASNELILLLTCSECYVKRLFVVTRCLFAHLTSFSCRSTNANSTWQGHYYFLNLREVSSYSF